MKNYKNPPIVEAEFSVFFRELISKNTMEAFKNSDYIKKNYPKRFDGFKLDVEISSKGEELSKNISSDGYLFNSEQNKAVSLKYSHLSFITTNKYEGWENEIKFLYDALEVLKMNNNDLYINQISSKFLNNIKLPEDFMDDFSKYLVVYPQIPKLINGKGSFIISFNVEENNLQGTIIEKLEYFNNERNLFVDIFVDKHVDNSEISASFDEIRVYKNKLFENLLRLETKCLFDI